MQRLIEIIEKFRNYRAPSQMIREISCSYTSRIPGSLNYANKFRLADRSCPPSPFPRNATARVLPSQLRRRIVPDDKSNVDEASGLIEPARINWPCLENAEPAVFVHLNRIFFRDPLP